MKRFEHFVVALIMLMCASVASAHSADEITDWGSEYLPEDELLYDRVASSLSNLECPDFSDIDVGNIVNSFGKIFRRFNVDIVWKEGLRERLSTLSVGEVVMEDGHTGEIQGAPLLPVRGVAMYITLVKGGERMWVTIGPYSTPATCVK